MKPGFRSHFWPASLQAAHLLLVLHPVATAANLSWDADGVSGAPSGGSGVWNTSSALWDNSGAMTTWANSPADAAVFAGTAGNVTLAEPIITGGMTLSTPGYVFLGTGMSGHTLTTSGIALNASATFGNSTTAANPIVRLSGDITGTGTLTSLAAWLSSDSATARQIAAPLVIGTGDGTRAIRLGDTTLSGTLTFTGSVTTNASGRGVEVMNGSTAVFQNGVQQSAAGYSITKGGGGTLVIAGSSNFTGSLAISSGVLELTSTGKLYNGGYNNSAVITVNSGATWRMPDFSYSGVGQLADYGARRVLNGGTIEVTGNSHTSGQDFTVNAAGGTFRYTPAGQTLTLSGNNNSNISIAGPLTFDTTGNISVTGGSAIIEGAGAILKTGAGTLTLTAANTYSGATTANQGTLSVTGTLRNSSSVTANTGTTIQLGATNMFVGSHSTPVASGRVLTANAATMVLTSAMESRIGNVTLTNGGTLTSNRPLTSWDVLLADTDAGPATISVTNSGGNTAPATMNGSGGLHLQNIQNLSIQDVTGDSAPDLTVTLVLADGGSAGGTGGIAKSGGGTLKLSAANTYTGATSITEGTLLLEGTLQSATTVANGATLAVSGTGGIQAPVTIQPGGLLDTTSASGTWSPAATQTLTAGRDTSPAADISGDLSLAPGATLQIGTGVGSTLTLDGSLTLDGGKILFDLKNSPAQPNDTIALTGNLDIASVSDLEFNLADLTLGNGSYPLIAASGGITGAPGDLNSLGLPSATGGRQTFTLSTTTIPNTLTLDVTGTAAILIWNNSQGTAKWNLTDSNWDNSGSDDVFVNGDAVRFEDTTHATENIELETTVETAAIHAANTAATTFIVAGAGSITGTTPLNVSGGGTLRLANTGGNDFSGAVNVSNNSTLELADPYALPPNGQILLSDATLDIGATMGAYVGTITLQGNSTLAGSTGTLDALAIDAQGGLITADLTGSGALGVSNNSTVGLASATSLAGPVGVAAGCTLELLGGASVLGNMSNSGTIRGMAGSGDTAAVTGIISGGGSLQQDGAGTLALGGAQAFSGNTTINAGVLDLSTGDGLLYANTYYGAPILAINAGGTLRASRINYSGANHLGQLTHNCPNNRLNGGTLDLTGPGAASARGWTVSGSSTVRTASGSSHTWLPNNEAWTQIDLENGATLTFDIGGTFVLNSTLMDYTGTPGGAGGISISSGGIVKSGPGLLHLASLSLTAVSNTHQFTGPTSVQQGTLLLDSNLGASPVTVASGASLAVGGNIATVGCGGLTLDSGATLALEINSGTLVSDQLNVAGNLDLGGATLSLADLGATTPASGTKFTLLTYTGTLSGTFDNLPEGATLAAGTNEFTIAYADSNAVTLTAVSGGYASWAATHAPGQTAAQDFDNDGVANGVEYILGGSGNASDLDKLPTFTVDGANLVFSFVRDQASKTPDTAVHILLGTDIDHWPVSYDVATAPEVSTVDNGNGTETISLTVPRAPDVRKFARLEVVITP